MPMDQSMTAPELRISQDRPRWSADRVFERLVKSTNRQPRPPLEALSHMLDLLEQAVSSVADEENIKAVVFNTLAQLVKTLNPDWTLFIAGSTAYNGALAWGDIDAVVVVPPDRSGHYPVALSVLHIIEKALNSQSLPAPLWNARLSFFPSAKVPLLSIESLSGVVIDVSINALNSIRHTLFFKVILETHSFIRPLLRLVKFWLAVRALPDMKEGGFPSLMWMTLAVCLWLGRSPCQASETQERLPQNLYTDLSRFFTAINSREKLAVNVSLSDKRISRRIINPRDVRMQMQHSNCESLLVVEDPADVLFEEFGIVGGDQVSQLRKFSPVIDDDIGPTAAPRGEDLASRVSAATWLVYIHELTRATRILRTIEKQLLSRGTETEEHSCSLLMALFNVPETPDLYRLPHTLLRPNGSVDSVICLVLAGGGLHLVEIFNICCTNLWWMKRYLSRRDNHSTIHAYLLVPSVAEVGSPGPLALDYYAKEGENRMLFHPTHFVCRVQAVRDEGRMYLEKSQWRKVERFLQAVAEAPYYFGRDEGPQAIQPVPVQCGICGGGGCAPRPEVLEGHCPASV